MACFSGPEIPNNGLKSLFDRSNPNSYAGTGTTWKDLIRNISYTNTVNSAGSETWMGSESSGITISVTLYKIGTFVGYAEQPVSKWSGTSDASFVLYHFGTTSGASFIDRVRWYANRGGVWDAISEMSYIQNGSKHHITLQHNNTSGGQLWINGNKFGSRTGPGVRANSTNPLKIFGPDMSQGSGTTLVENCYIWNRELTDIEIRQHFEAIRGRYSL